MSNQGNKIKEFRKGKGLLQKELAKKIGVTGRAIGYYENGQREPKLVIAKKLADVFETTIEELFNL